MATMPLPAVDRVEILTILDNTIDVLLAGAEGVRRLPLPPDAFAREKPIAEHGFAARVRVHRANTTETLLFDAGLSRGGLLHNIDVLEVDPRELHAIVLSHGHGDHTQGLAGLLDRLGPRRMPLVLHPDAFLERKLIFPDGHEIWLPPPDRGLLAREGIDLIEERGPSYLLGGLVLATGQIPRRTEFERGFPIHHARVEGRWQPDPLIHDDQALVVHVRDRGLVVLTGCGHAGAINTIRAAQELTGVETVYAVLGGLHLTGALFEPLVRPTVAALQALAPRRIVPAHCTGWKATHAIAAAMPEAFVQNSVGTTFVF